MRLILKAVVFLILILVISIICCIRPVDWRPYAETVYYQKTTDRLESVAAALPEPQRKPLMAGWSKAEITPPVGVPLAGYGDRKGKPSTGIHDRLFVRVITLKSGDTQIFIVGYDALFLHPPIARILQDSIKARFGLEADQFLYTATHTHSGPGGWGHGRVERQFAGPPDARVDRIFIDSTLVAFGRAITTVSPVSYAVGSFDAPVYVRNRLVGNQGQVDPEFVYLVLSRENQIGAVFATYSAHATVLSDNNMLISGDYPGYLERRLESETAELALFAAAGLGSHRPSGEGKAFERARFIGESLANRLLARLSELEFHQTAVLRYLRLEADMSSLQLRVSNGLRLAPWLAKRVLHVYDSYFQIVAIDNFVIIGSPGEFSGELALQVKKHANERGVKMTVTSFNGCYLGYVTPAKYYHLNKYETRLMSFFGPYTGTYFVDLMKRIVDVMAL